MLFLWLMFIYVKYNYGAILQKISQNTNLNTNVNHNHKKFFFNLTRGLEFMNFIEHFQNVPYCATIHKAGAYRHGRAWRSEIRARNLDNVSSFL